MARPKKEEMYRNHRITVRFTETEFSIIETAAKQANMLSLIHISEPTRPY